jgi:tetratricopeptide (TPR) repeat protein
VDELLSFFPEIENIQDSYALNGIGVYYNQIYQREKAVMLWQKAFDLIKDEQENFMELKSMLLYNLAIGEQDLKSKLEFYQKAFKLDSIIHGGFHRDIALDLIAIARVQTKLKDYTKSEDSLLRAMKIFTAIGDANTQLLYSSFGDLYEKKGEFDRALDWRIKDLENVIGRVGLDNVILVNKLKTIARTCENLGDDKRALLELNKARSILLKFPQLHAERAFIDIGIGRIYYYIDDSKNCVNYLETSLKLIQKMSIPFDARYSDNCYFILSSAYYKEGQFENAMDSVLKISNWDVGETDRNDLIENYELRANICYRLNNYEGAIDAYKKLLDLEDNPSKIAKFWNLIGGAYEHLSVYSMASEAYVQSMKYTTDKLRKSNACFRLGKVHKQMNNDQKSLMFLKRGFRLNRQPYFLVEMAEICSRMGQYREAANFFINAIRLAKKQSTDYKKDENLRTLVLKAQALVKNSSLSISLPKWTDLYDGSDDK